MTTDEAFTERLAKVQRGRGAAARAPLLIGSALAPVGVVLISLGWLGAAHTPVLQEVVAYAISGGLIGLALVIIGCFLYFSHWQTQQIRETRAQTLQLSGDLKIMQSSLAVLVSSLKEAGPVVLVATPAGTISHRPDCSIVAARNDLRPARADWAHCRICQPA